MKTRKKRDPEETDCYCDTCGEEAEPLYTVDKKQLCDRCKKELILRDRHQERIHLAPPPM